MMCPNFQHVTTKFNTGVNLTQHVCFRPRRQSQSLRKTGGDRSRPTDRLRPNSKGLDRQELKQMWRQEKSTTPAQDRQRERKGKP